MEPKDAKTLLTVLMLMTAAVIVLLPPEEVAAETEERIDRAVGLMAQIDELVERCTPEELERELLALKPQIDRANTSTVCEKTELDLPFGITSCNLVQLVRRGVADVWRGWVSGGGKNG